MMDHTHALSSTAGLFWCVLATIWGLMIGFALRLLTIGRRRKASPYLLGDNWRVGAGALAIHYAVLAFWAIVNGSTYHQAFRIGDFWAYLFPPFLSYGIALGYGIGRRRVGIFPPVTRIADE